MAKAILVVPTGEGAGLTSVALGLVHALDRCGAPVGFCKPITQLHASDSGPERSTLLVQSFAHLTPPEPLPLARAEELLGQGRENELLEEVIARYQQASKDTSIVIVEGLVPYPEQGYLVSLNVRIAQSLDADTILVTAPGNRTADQLQELLEISARPYGGVGHERLPGCILNMVGAPLDPRGRVRYEFVGENLDKAGTGAEQEASYAVCPIFQTRQFKILGCIAWQRSLITPRVLDIMRFTQAESLNPEADLNRRADHVAIGARPLAHGASTFRTGAFIITPGERDDVLLGACMAALNGVHIAGLLLTGGLRPSRTVWELCRPGLATGLPVLAVPDHILEAVLTITRLNLEVPLDDLQRVQQVVQFIAAHISLNWINELLHRTEERRLSPPAFRYRLVERARQANKRIVLPEGDEPRIIQAAVDCQRRGIVHCMLLGKPDKVLATAARHGIVLTDGIEIIDPPPLIPRYVAPLVELRQHKGLTPEMAEESLQDLVVLGTMMLQQGEVDGLVSGAVHTTANTIHLALQLIKIAPGAKRVSSIFFMCLPTQVLVYGDCAVIPHPSAEDLADIAIQSAESAKAFGIDPRIAMLSYSTGESGEGSDIEKVREATRLVREQRPDLLVDGPLQYDAAAIWDVARNKAPDSKVAGRATVFIFPDLNTGNTTYKAVQRSAEVISIGPMLQGLRKPVNDLSRGALVEDIVFTIALTAIQAKQAEKWE
ncbi:MAG TPA: phosphate acetyltransferase [Candidatus Competibacteraceae bacterium]|nr:phosphate acetyltransferase [Candidatus Competibacteraceae bacterium]